MVTGDAKNLHLRPVEPGMNLSTLTLPLIVPPTLATCAEVFAAVEIRASLLPVLKVPAVTVNKFEIVTQLALKLEMVKLEPDLLRVKL